jgi:hypothetical protein
VLAFGNTRQGDDDFIARVAGQRPDLRLRLAALDGVLEVNDRQGGDSAVGATTRLFLRKAGLALAGDTAVPATAILTCETAAMTAADARSPAVRAAARAKLPRPTIVFRYSSR